MTASPGVLREVWVKRGDEVVAEGAAAAIEDWLANKLEEIAVADGGWRTLYRHRDTALYWELTYPEGHMHGGGPRELRLLEIDDPATWS